MRKSTVRSTDIHSESGVWEDPMKVHGTALLGISSGRRLVSALMLTGFLFAATGCAPTVALKAPKEPIVINMNIKVEHEIKMNVDEDLEDLFDEDKEIF